MDRPFLTVLTMSGAVERSRLSVAPFVKKSPVSCQAIEIRGSVENLGTGRCSCLSVTQLSCLWHYLPD